MIAIWRDWQQKGLVSGAQLGSHPLHAHKATDGWPVVARVGSRKSWRMTIHVEPWLCF